ncbi:hypothetical protein HJC23_004492 [Cyclotella cryptica]|uniref:RING-type E3 ubiquitin transferase n=1 Tax=Cyclotella cryptica TaxID=29204 RepID=A0ABD3PSP0_9STRA|eukprot:CCRYP_011957-RB/>CCRYP_011957-RB protein AED:0.28 eAED:0.28 QI:177/1/1/1/0.66/0.75/4/956/326
MSHKRAPPQSKPAPNSLTSLAARDNSMAAAFAAATSNGEKPTYNPVSKWQEHVEVPGLTLFDIHREPRRANIDPLARVRVQLKVLSPEFHCSVCLSYIKNTRIVKECLHRFCNDCIEKCLRIGKRECPQCRIHIPSRRSLRPDVNFDNLIKSIYGDIEKLEEYEEEEIEKLNRDRNAHNAYAESRKRGVLHQVMQRNKRRNSSLENALLENAQSSISQSVTSTSIVGLKESTLIDFILRRHPQEIVVDRLKREYIRTSHDMTIENLKVFLGKKLGYDQYPHFQILTTAGERTVALPDSVTLALIRRDICDNPDSEIILYYRVFPQC